MEQIKGFFSSASSKVSSMNTLQRVGLAAGAYVAYALTSMAIVNISQRSRKYSATRDYRIVMMYNWRQLTPDRPACSSSGVGLQELRAPS